MDIDAFLHLQGISLKRHAHPAVMTCAESDRLVPSLPGARSKNLFLYGKKSKNSLLITAPSDSNVDLARLGELFGLSETSAVLAHPRVNTATVVVPKGALVRFLAATGHIPRVIDVPVRTFEEVMS